MKNFSLEYFEELSNRNHINQATYLRWCDFVKDATELEAFCMFSSLNRIRTDEYFFTPDPESQKKFWEKLGNLIVLFHCNLLTYKNQKLKNGEDSEIKTPEEYFNAFFNTFPDLGDSSLDEDEDN